MYKEVICVYYDKEIIQGKKKRILPIITVATLVVPGRSAMLASAYYVAVRYQEEERTLVQVQTVGRQ